MTPVKREEILPIDEYEGIRERFRRRIIELKKSRRVPLGDNMTVVFENHDTVLYQIQEMIRTERITADKGIQHEIDTYNEMIPARNELSAVIFVEYPEKEERDRMLVELAGLEDRFHLEVDGEKYAVRNETKATLKDRTTAVHYVKFPLPDAAADAVRSGDARVAVGVDHERYSARTELSGSVAEQLAEDLA